MIIKIKENAQTWFFARDEGDYDIIRQSAIEFIKDDMCGKLELYPHKPKQTGVYIEVTKFHRRDGFYCLYYKDAEIVLGKDEFEVVAECDFKELKI